MLQKCYIWNSHKVEQCYVRHNLFTVLNHRLYVLTYVHVIFRPSDTGESIKCYACWDPIMLTELKYLKYIKRLCWPNKVEAGSAYWWLWRQHFYGVWHSVIEVHQYSKTLVNLYQTTQHHNWENSTVHSRIFRLCIYFRIYIFNRQQLFSEHVRII